MNLGLITEPKVYTRKMFFKRLFGILIKDRIEKEENPFRIEVRVLPLKVKTIEKMPKKRLKRYIKKASEELSKSGAEKIVFSKFLRSFGLENNQDDYKERELFLKLAPLCIRQTAPLCGVDLMRESVCIRAIKMDRISEYLARDMCFDTNNIIINTKTKEQANRFCEDFYDETGLWVRVTDYSDATGGIYIDVDKAEIGFGKNLYVRSIDFGFDFSGYSVNQQDALVHLRGFKRDKIKWCYDYKK